MQAEPTQEEKPNKGPTPDELALLPFKVGEMIPWKGWMWELKKIGRGFIVWTPKHRLKVRNRK